MYGLRVALGGTSTILADTRRTASARVQAGAVTCELAAALSEAGCAAEVVQVGAGYALDIRGCFVPGNATFAICNVPGGDAATINDGAGVDFACGCQPDCPPPSSVSVCAFVASREECLLATASSQGGLASKPSATRTTTVVRVVSTTSTTTCPTCCDFIDRVPIGVDTPAELTELRLRVDDVSFEAGCGQSIDCRLLVAAQGPGFFVAGRNGIELCVSDPAGFTADRMIAECDIFSGFINPQSASVIEARDPQLRDVSGSTQPLVQ